MSLDQRSRDPLRDPLNDPNGVEHSLRRTERAGILSALVIVLFVVAAFFGAVLFYSHSRTEPGPFVAQSPAMTTPAQRAP